jgi:hypothetical protein
MDEIRDAILRELTVPVWPTAGKAFGFRTKEAAYAASRRGAIRTIPGLGRKKVVPTAWMREVLGLDQPAPRRRRRAETAA